MTLPESANVLQCGEGRYVSIGTGTRCTSKVTGKNTDGHFGLFEYKIEPNTTGPGRHIHHETAEIFYVVEGEVETIIGDETVMATAGATALVPTEEVRAFSNTSSQPAVLLIMFCPADSREKYFEDLAELTKDG
jgi:mannose-6-phosphate isomerase-like protein (cupin superfamily)